MRDLQLKARVTEHLGRLPLVFGLAYAVPVLLGTGPPRSGDPAAAAPARPAANLERTVRGDDHAQPSPPRAPAALRGVSTPDPMNRPAGARAPPTLQLPARPGSASKLMVGEFPEPLDRWYRFDTIMDARA